MKIAAVFSLYLAVATCSSIYIANDTVPWASADGAMKMSENSGFFQGDIVLNEHQKMSLLGLVDEDDERNLRKNPDYLWPNSTVPYYFTAGDFTAPEEKLIKQWLDELSNTTCVQFVPWTGQRDHVRIFNGPGCYSFVGRQTHEQVLSLTKYSTTAGHCIARSVVVHEFMHAAGFWHEHTRMDRDDYLNIYWENVDPKQAHNFNKVTNKTAITIGNYDFLSVMQYSATSFSKNGNATMSRKDGGKQLGPDVMGTVTTQDIEKMKALYKCGTVTPAPGKCLDTEQVAALCVMYAKQGACIAEKTKADMAKYCKKSCNIGC